MLHLLLLLAIQFTPEQRNFIWHKKECNTPYPTIEQEFFRKFGRHAPSKKNCRRIHKTVSDEGHSKNNNPGRSGRRKSATDPASTTAVLRDTTTTPIQSTRRRAIRLATSARSITRIHKAAGIRGYKRKLQQVLYPSDPMRRLAFCHWFNNLRGQYPTLLQQIIWSDESAFRQDGSGGVIPDTRYYATSAPANFTTSRANYSRLTHIWAAFNPRIGLIGPFFIEDLPVVQAAPQKTLKSVGYNELLRTKVLPFIRTWCNNNNCNITDFWFQQDGATCHTTAANRNLLTTEFQGQVITIIPRQTAVGEFPARSCDLTPMDYWYWAWLKGVVAAGGPYTSHASHRAAIEQAARTTNLVHMRNACYSVQRRVTACIRANGGHFERFL